MVDQKRGGSPRLRAGSIAIAGFMLLGCTAEPNALLLDTVCRNTYSGGNTNTPTCEVSGDVELTTGLSSDVIGVHFGATGVGELRIRLNAIPAAAQPQWSLEALIASTRREGSTLYRSLSWGSCGASCPVDPPDVEAGVGEDFARVRVIDNYEGSTFNTTTFETVPDDAALIFRGADLDLVDISTPGYDEDDGYLDF